MNVNFRSYQNISSEKMKEKLIIAIAVFPTGFVSFMTWRCLLKGTAWVNK